MFRRLLHDDDKGVAENLNETVCFNNNKTCEGLTVSSAFLPRIDILCSDVFWKICLVLTRECLRESSKIKSE